MKVLVACESSGIVRDKFRERGHEAVSCDLLPSERPGPHYQGDVRDLFGERWDLALMFPTCTYLCSSGLHWNTRRPERAQKTEEALAFVLEIWDGIKAPKKVLENPIGCLSTRWRKPSQIIHPWQFGEDASKATCLWLEGLPLLQPTTILPGGRQARRANQTASGQNKLGPSPDRWKLRSLTYPGVALAMSQQWGSLPL